MKPILIAKSLTSWHEEILTQRAIHYEQVTPLSFEYIYDPEVIQRQLQGAQQIVMSSSKSIEALELIPFAERIEKRIWTVGAHTAQELLKIGFIDVHHAKDSETLASTGQWHKNEPLLYLCGNLRKDTLCEFWLNHEIPFTETVIYNTQLQYPVIDGSRYSGVLFFSPSGVKSVCSSNALAQDTLIGSIGPTTTLCLGQYGFSNIIEAPENTFISLIDTIAKRI